MCLGGFFYPPRLLGGRCSYCLGFHNTPYNPSDVSKRLNELYADDAVQNRKGICEFILGGEQDTRLLNIRIFNERTKKRVYDSQTKEAKALGISNCPLCAVGNNANKTKIWALKDMDADHVTAWSKGGATDIGNCQMLCSSHNRAKAYKGRDGKTAKTVQSVKTVRLAHNVKTARSVTNALNVKCAKNVMNAQTP